MSEQRPRPSGTPPYWVRGTQIWWRYLRPGWTPGEPHTVHPMTVVQDDPDGLVAWLPAGTPVLLPTLPDGRGLREAGPDAMFSCPRIQDTGTWTDFDVLRIAPTGRPWSVWLFWKPGGPFDGYYVNLEDTQVRDDRNVYTSDRVLDLEVETDRTSRRKDEDELVQAVRQGRYTPTQAAEFEADAAAAELVVAAWGSPFCDGWEGFRPDPSWPVPGLPRPDVS